MSEVPTAVGHELGLPTVRCKSKAPPDLLDGNIPTRPGIDIIELGVLIGELEGDQVGDVVERTGHHIIPFLL